MHMKLPGKLECKQARQAHATNGRADAVICRAAGEACSAFRTGCLPDQVGLGDSELSVNVVRYNALQPREASRPWELLGNLSNLVPNRKFTPSALHKAMVMVLEGSIRPELQICCRHVQQSPPVPAAVIAP